MLDQPKRPLRVLVADPRANLEQLTSGSTDVDFTICSSGRESLRHADECLDYVVFSTELADIEFEDVVTMFLETAVDVGLIVVTDQVTAAEEALARQLGAVMYCEGMPDLDWFAQLRPRRTVTRAVAPRWTLDWQQRPRRLSPREREAIGQ